QSNVNSAGLEPPNVSTFMVSSYVSNYGGPSPLPQMALWHWCVLIDQVFTAKTGIPMFQQPRGYDADPIAIGLCCTMLYFRWFSHSDLQ
ncbi:hypothetical protein, partial [Escherichia coli]|uniref:hypothetical protein n=1 Tax=Escherichia coli TaxID=562 RepID=UPI0022852F22